MKSPSLGGTAVSGAFCCAEAQAAMEHKAATHTNAFQNPDRISVPPQNSQACLISSGLKWRRLQPTDFRPCTDQPPQAEAYATQALNQFRPVVNASVSNVFCSSSCALAEPVAGLALAERFTERTGISGK